MVLWCARLTLLAYVFQIAAFDHWQPDPADIYGVANTQQHAVHCHGANDCADSAGLAGPLVALALAPLPPQAVLEDLAPATVSPEEPFLPSPHLPPRSA